MTFFYDLNKKLAGIDKPAEQLNERGEKWIQKAVDPSHKGDLHKALHVAQGEKIPKGKIEKATHSKNAHLRHMAQFAKNVAKEDTMDEGFVDTVKSGAQSALQAIGQTLGHGSDEDMIKDLQRKAGVPVTGKVPPQGSSPAPGQNPTLSGQKPMAEEGGEPMTAKQKSFAKLAPPADKITFADKIAGAKKEVDEMLGDVAAEAMKNALVGGQKKLDKNNNGRLDAQDFAMLRKGAKQETDEGWDEMEKMVKARANKPKVGDVEHGHKHDIEHTATGRKVTRRHDDKGHSVGADDDEKVKDGEKRGRGRPKKADKAPERVTAKAYKHKGGRKMSKEEIEEAIAALEGHGYSVSKLDEKAVSVAQRRAAGIAHAAQKGEIPKSKLRGASKEMAKMPKGELHKFAATKEKGLPKKKEKTEESGTVAGSVATSDEAPKKSKGGAVVGKGIYDSLNRELESMIAESMNVSVNMTAGDDGEPHKSITVSAEGEEAEQLAQLLNLAGVAGKLQDAGHEGEVCPACGSANCGCDEVVDENSPDWPTNTAVTDQDDPHLNRWAGGLNKPKETGQTTIPVVNRDPRRGSFGPAEHAVDVREEKDLGMKLYAELKGFKG